MSRKPQLAVRLEDYDRLQNRARFLEETSHGIFQLLNKSEHNRAWLARRLGISPSLVSKVLEGSHNFTLETLADIGLAFDRGVHIVWGADPQEMRLPIDQAKPAGTETVIPIAQHLERRFAMQSLPAPFLTVGLQTMNMMSSPIQLSYGQTG